VGKEGLRNSLYVLGEQEKLVYLCIVALTFLASSTIRKSSLTLSITTRRKKRRVILEAALYLLSVSVEGRRLPLSQQRDLPPEYPTFIFATPWSQLTRGKNRRKLPHQPIHVRKKEVIRRDRSLFQPRQKKERSVHRLCARYRRLPRAALMRGGGGRGDLSCAVERERL